jgi:hypothetical protein
MTPFYFEVIRLNVKVKATFCEMSFYDQFFRAMEPLSVQYLANIIIKLKFIKNGGTAWPVNKSYHL